MSAKQKFEIEALVREGVGKCASRRLRREDNVPGVVYGGGKASIPLSLKSKDLLKSLEIEAFYSRILTLKTGTESERVILKDVQRHPYKPRVLHVDFQRVRADEKLHMHIPLHFIGGDKAPGVKEAGGIISHIMTDVEISCLPDHLPEYLDVDISELQVNQSLHLSDIKLPAEVEIIALSHDDDKPIVSIHLPRAEEEVIPTEAPAASEVPAIAQKGEESEGEEK